MGTQLPDLITTTGPVNAYLFPRVVFWWYSDTSHGPLQLSSHTSYTEPGQAYPLRPRLALPRPLKQCRPEKDMYHPNT